jgi:hypothetical protein
MREENHLKLQKRYFWEQVTIRKAAKLHHDPHLRPAGFSQAPANFMMKGLLLLLL